MRLLREPAKASARESRYAIPRKGRLWSWPAGRWTCSPPFQVGSFRKAEKPWSLKWMLTAKNKLSLRELQRRHNSRKYETAAPFAFAMTCKNIYCVCISYLARLSKKSKWQILVILASLKINYLQDSKDYKMAIFRVFRQPQQLWKTLKKSLCEVSPVLRGIQEAAKHLCFLKIRSGSRLLSSNILARLFA